MDLLIAVAVFVSGLFIGILIGALLINTFSGTDLSGPHDDYD